MGRVIKYWKLLLPLFLIFILFAFTRFYNLEYRSIFNWDQEQFSNQIYQLVKNHEPTLLGPRINSDTGFFLAPYFTYLLVPFFLLTNLHPYGMLIFQVFINVGFFFLAFFVVQKLFSTRYALFFLFLWTINFMLQDLETTTWWPILIPTGIMSLWYLEHKLFLNPKNYRLWIALGAVAGFFMNMHFQFLFVVIQTALFAFLVLLKNKKLPITHLVFAIVGFLLLFLPLLIFDLRNNFTNFNLFVAYFFNAGTVHTVRFYDWSLIYSHFMIPFIVLQTKLGGFITIAVLFATTLFLAKKTSGFRSMWYLSNAVMIAAAFLVFQNTTVLRPSEYYFLFLIPIFIISLIDLLITLRLTYALVVVCLILSGINLWSLRNNFVSNSDSLGNKNDVVTYIKQQVGDKKFFISFDGPPGTDDGFRYLIQAQGLNSSPDGKNPQIQVKLATPDPTKKFGGYTVHIPEELKR